MSYSEKYQQLENQIQELQKEVKRLKEEEINNKLPKNFAIDVVKKVIDDGDVAPADFRESPCTEYRYLFILESLNPLHC